MTTISRQTFTEIVLGLDRSRRHIVAIAGAPGSGKSTFAEMVCERLNDEMPGASAILPMDGFHFDDRVLEARGDRPRKGAPHTFDVGGLRSTLERLKRREEDVVAVPVFDRSIEIARAGARLIEREVPIILVEGNYLLLDEPRWAVLREFFDLTAFLDVPEATLRERLTDRWLGFGLEGETLRAKLEGNDLPNVATVVRRSIDPDYRIG
ncbi:nucleoside triphosphate hydrolase [Fulvimarina endophytica]|uniref:Nucleoside triphosphate hydrolase n=1 Tax=Fulvimarina endophytica TaxID=2293836 RepID=A0A371X1H1_9HYPH|nr:nucleoside triphosphate hydrolase [Fulvimarina endophytica]RFC63037.1 nucleoside triphosphate hydrolase [Fulvimarina endophytica]